MLQIRVVARLVKCSSFWYFIAASAANAGVALIVRGGRESVRYSAQVIGTFFVTLMLPLADALPSNLRSVYGRWGSSAYVPICFWLYVSKMLQVGWWFSNYDIPELKIDGVVSISLWRVWLKCHVMISALAAEFAFVSWRHPESTTMLKYRPLNEAVHAYADDADEGSSQAAPPGFADGAAQKV